MQTMKTIGDRVIPVIPVSSVSPLLSIRVVISRKALGEVTKAVQY